MPRKYRKKGILAKIETTYGTDAVPTGAANAVQMKDVQFQPMAGEEVSRDLLLPYLGHQGVVLTGEHVILSGSVEMAGAGAAGSVPGYGALLRMCAMSETISAGTEVVYAPVSEGEESGSIYYNEDGVRHVMLGCRGTYTLDLTPKQIPMINFTITGLKGTITDQAGPTVDLTSFQIPKPVSKASTTLSLHGASRLCEGITVDMGNQIEPRHLIGYEGIEFTDRQVTGQVIVEAELLASVDWFSIAQDRTRGVIAVAQGTVAGNIVEIDAPAVEVGRPTQGQTQNIVNYTLPLMFIPSSANDEITLTVK